jgi:hypothetical protein
MYQFSYKIEIYRRAVAGISICIFCIFSFNTILSHNSIHFIEEQFATLTAKTTSITRKAPRTITGSKRSKNHEENERADKGITAIRFLICRKCFWCASLIEWRGESHDRIARYSRASNNRCGRCGNNEVKSMPISLNESNKALLSSSLS